MTKFNVIIIGGGLGGLTAGATLSKLGKKVLLLEQHYVPGGCATTFKRKDFVMEVGLHEMDGLFDKDSKVQIFDFLEVNKSVQFIQVPELFHLKSSKADFTFPHGTASAQKALIDKFPKEEKGINEYFKLINGVLNEIAKMPTEKWKTRIIYPFMPFLFSNIVQSSKTSIGHWLDKHLQDAELKLILTANLLYYGDDPYKMSLLYFSLAQASYIGGGGHFIKGGSQKLSDYLVEYIQSHGGQVMLGAKVEKILVEKGKANGVQFRDSFNCESQPVTIYADSIIANAAIPNIAPMLPTAYSSLLEEKIKKQEIACSLLSIYMGFDINLRQIGIKHYSTFIQDDSVKDLIDMKVNYQGDWNKKGFVFVDYGQIDSGLVPSGKSFGVICAADYLSEWEGLNAEVYKIKKEQVAQSFIQKLESHYPGIRQHLVYYEVGTAKTIQKYTLNPKGTPYGYAQTPAQSGSGRMPSKSPIKNLFFASAWSFPGGGFTGAILSGFLSAISMNKKIRWSIQDSNLLSDSRIVKLIRSEQIAENTFQLTFEKPNGFNHISGQYVILRLNNPMYNELDMPLRSLSIVSHPDEPTLRFALRTSNSSFKLSCEQMKVGEESTIFGPLGEFFVRPDYENIVFLISGIGITPIMPMLKDLERNQFKGKVFLFYSNKKESSAAYHNELNKINIENYTYIPITTATDKRIDRELLTVYLKDFNKFNFMLVGTSSFLNTMKDILINEGVDRAKIKEDDFG